MIGESDRTALKKAFDAWPARLTPYGHPEQEPAFTLRMEERGALVRAQLAAGIFSVVLLREFLIDVAYWKMPRNRQQYEDYVARNSDATISRVFRALVEAMEDRARVQACTELMGFGGGTGQTRMASAVLRFMWPDEYGVIDWRNWAVLSNCGYHFLSTPLLPKLATTPSALKEAMYDCDKYLTYLGVLRQLMPVLGLKHAADVDLALYSYSTEPWPFPEFRTAPEVAQRLVSQLRAKQRVRTKQLQLHEIYEAYWPEWEALRTLPAVEQRDQKVDFLWMCLAITPENVTVWDEATLMKLPYSVKHKRDLEELSQKIEKWSLQRAVDELDHFMWSMRLKGDGFGVLP